MATVTYEQDDNPDHPGKIILDGNEQTALSGPPNNGRLDHVGDFVFAEFLAVRIECIRTSDDTMTIRLILNPDGAYYYYDETIEKVMENVPITF